MGLCASCFAPTPVSDDSGEKLQQRRGTGSGRRKQARGDGASTKLTGQNVQQHNQENGQRMLHRHGHGEDEDDYQSCHDAFSVTGDGSFGDNSSPHHSMSLRSPYTGAHGHHAVHMNGAVASKPGHSHNMGSLHPAGDSRAQTSFASAQQGTQSEVDSAAAGHAAAAAEGETTLQDAREAHSVVGDSETESDVGAMLPTDMNPIKRSIVGCLTMLDGLSIGGPGAGQHPGHHSTSPGQGGGQQGSGVTATPSTPGRWSRRMGGPLVEAGCSLHERDRSKGALEVWRSWEDAGAHTFHVRSLEYMKSKIKVVSEPAMYKLVATDIFATSTKQNHIAKHIHLPPCGNPVMAGDVALPPMLIFNLQLPLYMPTLFGSCDGPGVSIIFYCTLPDGFDPSQFENQKSLGLFKRFVTNGREVDGSPTRDRLKLIPRVVNVEEWVEKGPLSPAEHKLLSTYHEKPVLSRPQHLFFQNRKYLEVDLDLHSYTYLARRAITTYLARIPLVIWDNAFVIQGNAQDELPEQLLAAGRVFRVDFTQVKPLEFYSTQALSHSAAQHEELHEDDNTPQHAVAASG